MDESARDLLDKFLGLIKGIKNFTPARKRKIWRLLVGHPWFLKRLKSCTQDVLKDQRLRQEEIESFMQDVIVRIETQVREDPTLNVDLQCVDVTFESWMNSIIKFNCLDEKKAKKKRQHSEIVTIPLEDDIEQAPPDTIQLQRRCAFEQAVRKLPHQQRQALTLYLRDGMKIKDIARRMGLPFGTVRRRLDDAREGVKRMLRDRNIQ